MRQGGAGADLGATTRRDDATRRGEATRRGGDDDGHGHGHGGRASRMMRDARTRERARMDG
jgi:hypothetical protein